MSDSKILLFFSFEKNDDLGLNEIDLNLFNFVYILEWAKQDPWGLRAVIVYCSKLSFCQNDSPNGGSFWQMFATIHYDSATRPQRSCFANPTIFI